MHSIRVKDIHTGSALVVSIFRAEWKPEPDAVVMMTDAGGATFMARLSVTHAREIAAALVAAADEIEPPKITAAPLAGDEFTPGAIVAHPAPDALKGTTKIDDCPDCDGVGIIRQPDRPEDLLCRRCDGRGVLSATVHDAGQQVAKFDGLKPAFGQPPAIPSRCDECGNIVSAGDRDSGPTHRPPTSDAAACSRHAPF